tara:strand:- start:1250 stop:1552 length:303 start_codon:yes stop_codon:yes gene_type:complete
MTEPQYLKKTVKTNDILDIDDIVNSLKKKGKRKKVVSSDDIGKLLNTKNNDQRGGKKEKKEKRTTVKSEIKELNLKIDKLTELVIKLSNRLEQVYEFVDE